MTQDDRILGDRTIQRMKALEVAQERRRERKVLKAKLRRGEVDPWALVRGELAEHEPTVQSWKLEQLLGAIPGIGPARTHEVLRVFRASPLLRVAALSDDRRIELAELARSAVEIVIEDLEQRRRSQQ